MGQLETFQQTGLSQSDFAVCNRFVGALSIFEQMRVTITLTTNLPVDVYDGGFLSETNDNAYFLGNDMCNQQFPDSAPVLQPHQPLTYNFWLVLPDELSPDNPVPVPQTLAETFALQIPILFGSYATATFTGPRVFQGCLGSSGGDLVSLTSAIPSEFGGTPGCTAGGGSFTGLAG
jgi:hypothetical protein